MNDENLKVEGEFTLSLNPEYSDWKCHLFGPQGIGITYQPIKGQVPNAFVRWMMKVCFACTWVKVDKEG